ncbi:SFB3 (YHR098C) [Zygosaccharomyces parabailii]|nr:SFB3 (YHR098C) [Zygosaccharomyces parabailii]
MEPEALAKDISSLSLDQTASRHTGRKGRRPNRAYHTLGSASGTPNTTPFLNASVSQDSFQFTPNVPQAPFSPREIQGSPATMAIPGFPQGSPALMPQSQERLNSVAESPAAAWFPQGNSPVQSSSHFVSTQRWEDQMLHLAKTFETSRDSVPPLPTTVYYSLDQGSCDPRLLSLSMYNIPVDEHLRSATKLPLGLTIQPFAVTIPEEPMPLVDQRAEPGPLRCKRCRAYINPGFKFGYDSTAVCNICGVKMRMPSNDFVSQGFDIQGPDTAYKSETQKGSVEFLVPQMYNAIQDQPAIPLHYVFLIDLSLFANENKSSLAVVEGVRSSIEYIAEFQPNCKVAIMAYDSKVRFYNLRSDSETPQEYVITDVNDVFLPFCNGLFVKPRESMSLIDATLDKIVEHISWDKFSHVASVCYGSALEAAKLAIDTVTKGQGGKIICSLNSLPTAGNGNLVLRKDDAARKNLKCDNHLYKKLGNQLLRSYISVDLYVTSSAFVDMATVAYPVEATSGNLKWYQDFNHERDAFTLINDMMQNVANITGYQALLKVRCSTGLNVDQYYCESSDFSDTDPMIPVLTKDTTLDVLLKYDQKLTAGKNISFQVALLYTDIDGNRKVRCMNTSGAISDNIGEVFKFLNQNVALRIMIKDVIQSLGDCNFPEIRKAIDNKVVDILTQYKALVGGSLTSQLVLPEALKTLPSYILAFEKSELMMPNNQSTRGNARIYDLYKYKNMNSAQLQYKLYPQIIPLHVLLGEEDLSFYDANEKMLQVRPNSLDALSVRSGHQHLTNGGCYLIFQGETVYLWLNENTNRMLLQDLLQVDEEAPISQISLFGGSLPEVGTDVNQKALDVVRNWGHITNKSYLPVILLRPNVDQHYAQVMNQLFCEDRSIHRIESLDNYLVAMHRRIQEKLKDDDYTKVQTNTHTVEQDGNLLQKFVQF